MQPAVQTYLPVDQQGQLTRYSPQLSVEGGAQSQDLNLQSSQMYFALVIVTEVTSPSTVPSPVVKTGTASLSGSAMPRALSHRLSSVL